MFNISSIHANSYKWKIYGEPPVDQMVYHNHENSRFLTVPKIFATINKYHSKNFSLYIAIKKCYIFSKPDLCYREAMSWNHPAKQYPQLNTVEKKHA